jgi:hypothetical protein
VQFHATVVEAYLGEFDLHTVHFDDGHDQYLQLRVPEVPEDPREVEPGYGLVEVEANSQLYCGVNCFSAAELGRARFRLALARDDRLVKQFGGEVVVTFALDDAAFAGLRAGLDRAFRDFPGFQVTAGG